MAGRGKKRTKRQEDALFLKSTKIRKLPHDDSHTRQHITHSRHTKEEIMSCTPKLLPSIPLRPPHPPLLKEQEPPGEAMQDEEAGGMPDPSELDGAQTQVSDHPVSLFLVPLLTDEESAGPRCTTCYFCAD
jgi:hypothetical protein